MAVTIRQIAEIAGVSRGTVDRALNNRYGVKPEIAERVRRIAEELGYQPDLVAKLLSDRQYTKCVVGIILVTEDNAFYDDVQLGIQAALKEVSGFGIGHMIRTMTRYDVAEQLRLMDEMVESGVNGIVMTPLQCDKVVQKINELNAKSIRVIAINTDILHSERMAYVGCQHKKSGVMLAGLLGMIADQRPVRLGFLTGSPKNLAVMRRTEGFENTLRTCFPNIAVECCCANEDNDALSYVQTGAMLRDHYSLDMLCVLGAGIVGALKAVRESGCAGRMKVMVYDLIDEVRHGLMDGTVTATITQNPFQQGYKGVQLMCKYLLYDQPPERISYYTELSIITKYCLDT